MAFAAGATTSGNVAIIAASVSRMLRWSELKLPVAAVLIVAGASASALTYIQRREPEPQAASTPKNQSKSPTAAVSSPDDQRKVVKSKEWFVAEVDPARRTISLDDRNADHTKEVVGLASAQGATVPWGLRFAGIKVADDARIAVDDQPGELSGVRTGMRVAIDLAPDRLVITMIRAHSPFPPARVCIVEEVDLNARTISVSLGETGARLDKLRLTRGARIILLNAPPNGAVRFQTLALRDLRPGIAVALTLQMSQDGRFDVSSVMCSASKATPNP
jgi:hypothetical protein